MEETFARFLRAIAPYVVVCGSYARFEETEDSDIDCFLRFRPRDEVDLEIGNESYMPEVVDIIRENDFVVDSCIVGHIAVERQRNVPKMVEISEHYQIRRTESLFIREIYGVPMVCGVDDKYAPTEELYDVPAWDECAGDMVIKWPIPAYADLVE